jgi:hypothetical protein
VRFAASLIVAVGVGVAACSSSLQPGPSGNDGGAAGDAQYPVTFTCLPDGGADCPSGQTCPELPLSSSSCGDLPGVLGYPATPQTVGRPIGCAVGLSYGNPYFSNTQVQCFCTDFADMVSWACPI